MHSFHDICAHAQPSPAHNSAAEAYYATLLNPTSPRVTATAIDMAHWFWQLHHGQRYNRYALHNN
jgi:hypothetical protein